MYGLALTLFLWPNHLEIIRFFRRVLPRRSGGNYLEVGPGHGVFIRYATRYGGFASYLGIDVSSTSLEMTRRLLSCDSTIDRRTWKLLHGDFLATSDIQGQFDAIVMGEVLEHVEEPLRFLQRIKDLASEGAFIFITTAVNAPAIDHIYLFRTVDEVCDMAIQAKLQVKDVLATPYKGCTMEETVLQKLPVNVAMVLEA
jgi:2-polyprenyl-3-methyl-5-hydroxy-6-metoxy-1,4-benzoquinol methylase